MQVTVTDSDLGTIDNQGSVVIVTGTGQGQRITFAGDHRAMWDFLAAVQGEGSAIAEVDPWQIISRVPVPG